MTEEVGIEIYGDTRQANKNVKVLTKNVDKLERAADDVNDTLAEAKRVTPVYTQLGGAVKALAAGFAIKEIFDFSLTLANTTDEIRRMDAQLTILSGRSDLFDTVADSASGLGISIKDASDIVAQFVIAGKDIGLLSDEALAVTENVVKLGRIGGKSIQEVASASIQLTQGLAKGKLDGDELTSVLENLPLVADRIAAHMGEARGSLKDLGAEGKITATVVTEALGGSIDEINDQFEQLPKSVAGSRQIFVNELQQIGALIGETFQVPEAFTNLIGFATEKLREFKAELEERGGPEQRFIVGRIDKTVEEIQQVNRELEILQKRAKRFEEGYVPGGSSAEKRFQAVNAEILVQQDLLDDLHMRVGRYAVNIQTVNAAKEEELRLEKEKEEALSKTAKAQLKAQKAEEEATTRRKVALKEEKAEVARQRKEAAEVAETTREEEAWQRIEELHQREYESARAKFEKLRNLGLTEAQQLELLRDQRLLQAQTLQDALYINEAEGAEARAAINKEYAEGKKELDKSLIDGTQVVTELATSAIQEMSSIWSRTFLDNEQDFDEMILGMIKNLTRLAAELLFFQPLINSVAGALGSSGATPAPVTTIPIPRRALGTSYVPRDGLNYLHRGEKVVPAGKNSGTTVIINEAEPGTTVDRRETAGGEEIIEVLMARVNSDMANGTLGQTTANKFGLQTQGILR